MDNTIKHEGIVERIENGIAYVKIIQHSLFYNLFHLITCAIIHEKTQGVKYFFLTPLIF